MVKPSITLNGYLSAMFPKHRSLQLFPQQRGFLLPLALFIIVVMGLLALTISRTATQSQTSVVQELMNLQSFYTAESGAQRGMKVLFFDVSGRKAADAECLNMNLAWGYSGADGLSACRVTVICHCHYQNGNVCVPSDHANYLLTAPAGTLKSFYTVTSRGECGEGQYRAERTIEVGAFMEQEP